MEERLNMKKFAFMFLFICSFVLTFIGLGFGALSLYYKIMPNIGLIIGFIGSIISDINCILIYKNHKKTEEYERKLKEMGWM